MVIRALDRKLFRDIGAMRTQAIAIALVAASGVALFMATVTAYRSLRLSEAAYYEQNRFAHVFAHLARAPIGVAREVAMLPGVAAADGRIVTDAVLDVPAVREPATGLILSVAPRAGHRVNGVYLRRGRQVEPGSPGEVLVNEPFAEKNGLQPGDTIGATVAGARIELRIVGIALSPEFVMQMPPAGIAPDDRRFGIFWMDRDELARATNLRDAVNDLVVRLAPGASEPAVITALDQLLEPYGGTGAFGRDSQRSHVELENHIAQLQGLSLVLPAIFMMVAAFLVNVVLGRVVGTQRASIGMLKAFGYGNARVAFHYASVALIIVAVGIAIGLPIGIWLGRLIARYYATFFRFPVLVFSVEPFVWLTAVVVTTATSLAGTFGTLRAIVATPPIVAMAPAVPYRPRRLDRMAVLRVVPPALLMIVRNLSRRPLRAALTTTGMALAVAVLVLGGSSNDSLTRMIDVQFQNAHREDLSVTLAHRQSLSRLPDFASLPGVRRAEPSRVVPARLRVRGAARDVSLTGLPSGHTLRHIVNTRFERVVTPDEGVVVNRWLARRLGIERGDEVTLEIREGQRRFLTARVVFLVDEPVGSTVYIDLETLGRLLDEPDTFSAVSLLIDPLHQQEVYDVLKRAPQAIGVQDRRDARANFASMAETSMAFIRLIEVIFSVVIAFGVVYNAARIALAERSHELATLRILGFTRREIAGLLFGEVGVQAAVALPIGFLSGYALSGWVAASMSNDRFRMPVMVEPSTYAFAALVFVTATIGSLMLVRRRLHQLNLVEVLKARE
ncbi:MAG TPA: FtsX-like permease family protein [Vicinamibacterales bacterium]|nr:FtsX-like permease family protein [Vicinamibacterales bacterium]